MSAVYNIISCARKISLHHFPAFSERCLGIFVRIARRKLPLDAQTKARGAREECALPFPLGGLSDVNDETIKLHLQIVCARS